MLNLLISNLVSQRGKQDDCIKTTRIVKIYLYTTTCPLTQNSKFYCPIFIRSRSFSSLAYFSHSITSSEFLAERYGVLSFAIFAISLSLCIRNESAKNMLNRSGPKIEPYGTPNIIASHSLYELFTLVLCFLCDR